MLKRILAAALLAMTCVAAPAFAKDDKLTAPALTYAFTVTMKAGAPVELGEVDGVRRRFIPNLGGSVFGPKLRGEVLPGGGDWQSVLPGGVSKVDIRYFLKTTDGTIVDVTSPGIRVASAEIAERLARGEDVDPMAYYYRVTPQLRINRGAQDWLGKTVFVAKGARRPDHVTFDFFAVE